ncbi:hypothetical protein MRX96_013972 [Rhipicephalus microplus]
MRAHRFVYGSFSFTTRAVRRYSFQPDGRTNELETLVDRCLLSGENVIPELEEISRPEELVERVRCCCCSSQLLHDRP